MRNRCVLTVLAMLGVARVAGADGLAIISERAVAEYTQYAPAFSPDSDYLAWIEVREPGRNSYVQVLDIGTGDTRRVPEEGRATGFCWGPGGHVLAYVDAYDPRRLAMTDLDLDASWEVPLASGEAAHLIWTHGGIQCVVTKGGRYERAAPYLARVLPETGEVELLTGPMAVDSQLFSQSDSCTAFAWSPGGNIAGLLCSADRKFLYLWKIGVPDTAPEDHLRRLKLAPPGAPCLAIGPGGSEIFLTAGPAGDRNTTAIWRYRPEDKQAEPMVGFAIDEEWPLCMAVSPAGDKLAILSTTIQADDIASARLRVADLARAGVWADKQVNLEESRVQSTPIPSPPPEMCWSPDGEWVAYAVGGKVRLADIGTETDLCMSHLKQLSLAFLMFAGDFDEALPGPKHVAFAFYKENDPNFRAVEGVDWWTALIDRYVRDESMMRCPLMGEGEGSGYVYPQHLWGNMLREIQNPSKTVLLMDSAPRHEGKRVVAFADGHVEVVAEEDVGRLLKGK